MCELYPISGFYFLSRRISALQVILLYRFVDQYALVFQKRNFSKNDEDTIFLDLSA